MVAVILRLALMAVSVVPAASNSRRLRWRSVGIPFQTALSSSNSLLFSSVRNVSYTASAASFCSDSDNLTPAANQILPEFVKQGTLMPGLYLVGTPIGNLEDITLRALRVLKSAHVVLSEDTRHSRKLLQYYGIKTPLISYHKFNESQREETVLNRLKEGEVVALISDAGMPGISDPGGELAKLCIEENIPVVPVPGPSALVAALSASGLSTDEFTFVGFLPKHAGSRRERLLVSANQTATQIFFVPPHKLHQFVEETSSFFSESRKCVMAREMTKIHEEFWRGTLGEAKEAFATRQPKGEITFLIEGMPNCVQESVPDSQIENELRDLISSGHSLSMAVKLVAEGTSRKRKEIYTLALQKFGKKLETEDE